MRSYISIKSAMLAGFVATLAMTMFTYMAPLMGFEMNIPKMLANTMGAPIIVGWIAHFMMGEILAILFASVFLTATEKISNIRNGALFGLIPWLVTQIMVMPMMSIMSGAGYMDGFFSGSIMIAMASLAGHLIYGAILGGLYKLQLTKTSAAVQRG